MRSFVRISLLVAMLSACFANYARPAVPVAINEFMASNSSHLRDPQGQYDDWIEIHNYGFDAIDTGGMYLTDDFSAPDKWRFPGNSPEATTIPAGGYLLIWADNDRADAGLHANFKLDADGEEIALFDSDGVTLIDSIVFGNQTADISYGRFPDANDSMRFFGIPSPAAQNNSGYLGEVADTEFSHNRGFYETPFSVTIASETEDAVIYYTLDGTDPYVPVGGGRFPTGSVYRGPISINRTTCLRARTVKPGFKPTGADTKTYIFLHDVIRQDHQTTLDAGFPSSWNGTSPDYGMDPDVIGRNSRDLFGEIYARTIRDDLKSIPAMSIVMDIDDMFGAEGIYSNPTRSGVAWERPASVELIYPDGTAGFQINCGIRIQGGAFRGFGLTKKKSFRLLFKGSYGPTRLEFPLFGEGATDRFDTIVLRAGANDGYSWSSARYTEQYTRDEFGRSLQRATGHAGAHGTFVHLYVNGVYWGLYNPVERPDNSFSASYYGGDKDNWDAMHDNSATDGDRTAWNQMIAKCRQAAGSGAAYYELQGSNPDGTLNPAYPNLLDMTNYVDYLIVNLWGGNWDWPWKNWWAGRDRSPDNTGFKFYCWDYENTMGNNLSRSPLNKNALNNRFTQAGQPHESLKQNAEYRLFFADRVHKFFFNGGVLTPDVLIARYEELAAGVERAIVAESARWGDQHHNTPLTLEQWYDRDSNYNDGRAGLGWIIEHYLPQRSDIVLQQFRNAGLYPNVEAPAFRMGGSARHGGQITSRDLLAMFAPTQTIYYTLDGSDPRVPGTLGGGVSTTLVIENAPKRVLLPSGPVGEGWKGASAFDDSAWIAGTGGIGYERGSGYQNYFDIDLGSQMYQGATGCFVRIPFDLVQAPSQFGSLTLSVRYDDGFVAYLNGVEAARSNAPGSPQWDSAATTQNTDSAAKVLEDFDVSAHLNALRRGDNILAIHGLNQRPNSSDFLISAELTATGNAAPGEIGVSASAIRYAGVITLSQSAKVKARVLSGRTWSALNEAVFSVGPVQESLRITEIMYHPHEPTDEFIELKNVGSETINLNLVSFTDGIDFTFPDVELAAGEYAVVVQGRGFFEARYGANVNIAGQYSDSLNDAGETIRLEDAIGRTILDFTYEGSWHSLADDDGFSLAMIEPDNSDPDSWDLEYSWRPSAYAGGSPGHDDSGIVPEPGSVVINELLANSPGAADWIELRNTTTATIDIGGWFLSDSRDNIGKYEIADGTRIGGHEYLVFRQDDHFGNNDDPGCHTPFGLSENGEQLYLSSAEEGVLTGYRDSKHFGASAAGVSFGRYYKISTDNYEFVAMAHNTPGAANSSPGVGPVVISEIMYNPDWPADGSYANDQYEYVELHNISAEPVTLYDYEKGEAWKFTDGIEYTFPIESSVTIPGGGYLMVVKNTAAFSWRYPHVPPENILGPYDGKLGNAGEKLELSMPGGESGQCFYICADRTYYSDGSHPQDVLGSMDLWPIGADGYGKSLTRRHLADYGNDPENWADSAPSPGE